MDTPERRHHSRLRTSNATKPRPSCTTPTAKGRRDATSRDIQKPSRADTLLRAGIAVAIAAAGVNIGLGYKDADNAGKPRANTSDLPESTAFMTYTKGTARGTLPEGLIIRESNAVDRTPGSDNSCGVITADSKISSTPIIKAEPAAAPNGEFVGFTPESLKNVATSDLGKCRGQAGRVWVAQAAAGLTLR